MIGASAAAVHLVVVTLLVRLYQWAPLAANVGGWMVAFWVSFAGHFHWTFRGHARSARGAWGRFLLLSATGFVLNESLYAAGLAWLPLRFDWLLVLVLIVTAVLTFLLSRHWAFAGTVDRQ